MSVALRLYEQLTEAGEDKTRAKAIAEAFEQLEERYPHLREIATGGQVRESELRLQREIEQVRLEIKEVEGKLGKEIEQVRLEIKEVEVKLQQTEVRLLGAIHRQTYWIIGSVGTIVAFIRFLDWLLASLPK